MLGISKRKCTMDTPVHINGNEKKKKTEYRNSYIAYLNIQNVIPMSCLLVFGVIIPGLFEPPVRTLRATIPENESHIFR